ncbi:uncharacterized protein LOC114209408 [Eumetopias jubatus]|uniref:uncharacterized protein LOC114209408 n=1 Tax=Eumetopias jubatus TaxID=34886 RepID=UPI001016BE7C|nr:uncharacterized protein LOC114209408 [Eumetopias jubatus]
MVATRLLEATGPPARQRVQGTCLGLGDRPTPGDLRTKPAPAGSAPQPGTPQRLVPGRPGQTSLLRPATHEALPARPPSAPRPEQALTKGLAEEAAPTGRGALRGRTRARCGAGTRARCGASPLAAGAARPPARHRPGAPRRGAARVQARGPSPRLWLPARAPHSPRSARARLSAVFAFAFLPPSLRKMKVTVAVARARAAAVEERGEESGGGRRGACELGPPPAPEEVAARPGLLYPAKQSPGWTAEKQENGFPAAVGNELCIPFIIRMCGLGTVWIQLAWIQAEPLRVEPSSLMPTSKEGDPETADPVGVSRGGKRAVLTLVPEFTACWRETASRPGRMQPVGKAEQSG